MAIGSGKGMGSFQFNFFHKIPRFNHFTCFNELRTESKCACEKICPSFLRCLSNTLYNMSTFTLYYNYLSDVTVLILFSYY